MKYRLAPLSLFLVILMLPFVFVGCGGKKLEDGYYLPPGTAYLNAEGECIWGSFGYLPAMRIFEGRIQIGLMGYSADRYYVASIDDVDDPNRITGPEAAAIECESILANGLKFVDSEEFMFLESSTTISNSSEVKDLDLAISAFGFDADLEAILFEIEGDRLCGKSDWISDFATQEVLSVTSSCLSELFNFRDFSGTTRESIGDYYPTEYSLVNLVKPPVAAGEVLYLKYRTIDDGLCLSPTTPELDARSATTRPSEVPDWACYRKIALVADTPFPVLSLPAK